MLDHILQCHLGHLICGRCYQKLTVNACPSCKVEYPGGQPARNRTLEEIVERLDFKCKNGCGFIGQPSVMRVHREICWKRVTRCPCTSVDTALATIWCHHYIPLEELTSHYRKEHILYYQIGQEFIIPIIGYLKMPFQRSPLVTRSARILDVRSPDNFAVIKLFCCDFMDEEGSEAFEHENGVFLQVRVFHALEPLLVTVTIQDGKEVLLKGPCAKSQRLCQDVDEEEEQINEIDDTGVHFFNLKQLRNVIADR